MQRRTHSAAAALGFGLVSLVRPIAAAAASSAFFLTLPTLYSCRTRPLTVTVSTKTTTPQHPPPPAVVARMSIQKLDSPAAERNKIPIWQFLQDEILPTLFDKIMKDDDDAINTNSKNSSLSVLEIAAGSGIHTVHFARQLASLLHQDVMGQPKRPRRLEITWQPTDAEEQSRESILAYMNDDTALKSEPVTVLPPLPLTLNEFGIMETDTRKELSSNKRFDLIVNINMIHIAPIEALDGLVQVASQLLVKGGDGFLLLYGPFKINGECVESNQYVQAYTAIWTL